VSSPTFVDAGIRTRALASLYLAGAAIGAVSLLPHSADSNDFALWSNVLLATATGGVLFLTRARLPEWAIQVLLVVGTLVITRAVLYSGEKVSFYAVWYIWIGLYAFYFLGRLWASLQVAFASAMFAVTLIAEPSGSPVARWLTTVTTLVVAGVFIDTLVSRARRQAVAAEEARDGMAWSGVLRETDLLARYGGEEFALALPDCPADKALAVIERIRQVTPDGETLSAGVAFWNGSESADDLLGRADAALYQAKASGRNQAVIVEG
jgi:hypothetical protein